MPLTDEDIRRISSAGKEDFYHEDTKQLKNIEGRCVFLSEKGDCTIYSIRPQGCRLYPLIMALPERMPVLDEQCPHRDEFRVDPDDVVELERLIDTLLEEGA
ncbi:MAG: YkgJ family cysteine cluster protein [Candidatus Thermoplasmatota archaeon]|nr:YkgJ family cysteine cluster protein [Candidatus Thermoplasmatota archaeon]